VEGSESGSDYDVYYYLEEEEGAENRIIFLEDRKGETEEEQHQRESDHWKYCCTYGYNKFNSFNLFTIKERLFRAVAGDLIAMEAMRIFLSSFYWKFVNYCEPNLHSMTPLNQQRFTEILILLAPGLVSTRYTAKAVSIVGRDPNEVRATDIQHLQFCLDMFFHAAVMNGQLGRIALADMCISAFYAPCLNWGNDERFIGYHIKQTALGDSLFEDLPEIHYFSDHVWPNWLNPIPEAVIPTELD
jgi:hypothetical protein